MLLVFKLERGFGRVLSVCIEVVVGLRGPESVLGSSSSIVLNELSALSWGN